MYWWDGLDSNQESRRLLIYSQGQVAVPENVPKPCFLKRLQAPGPQIIQKTRRKRQAVTREDDARALLQGTCRIAIRWLQTLGVLPHSFSPMPKDEHRNVARRPQVSGQRQFI